MTMTTPRSTIPLQLDGCIRTHQWSESCVTRHTAWSPPGWGRGTPAAGITSAIEYSMSWCSFSKPDRVTKCRPTCVYDVADCKHTGCSINGVLRTMSCYLMPRIQRWHRMWNACLFVYLSYIVWTDRRSPTGFGFVVVPRLFLYS